jgi:TolB protein
MMNQPTNQLTQNLIHPEEFSGELAGHRFLMSSVRTGNTEIFCIDPYTGSATNLTRKPTSHQRYPSWSPDGSRIAFTSDRNGAYNLYTMDTLGENVQQLTNEPAPLTVYFPNWSGDGKRIIFGLAGCDPPLMCSIDASGGAKRILGVGRDPHISPDGKLLAFTKFLSVGYTVFLLDTCNSQVSQITSHENPMGAVTPTFSPDGKFILYSDSVGNALELFRVSVESGEIRQLTDLGQFSTCAAWSPDMRWISFRVTDEDFWNHADRMQLAYKERRPDKRPVWVMRADGSETHPLEALRYQCGIDGSRAVWDPLGTSR